MKRARFTLLFLGLLLTIGLPAPAAPLSPAPNGLMCDLLAHPERVPIANSHPKFGWIVRSKEKDDIQAAYQIRVTEGETSPAVGRGRGWDSGRIASDRSFAIPYAGPPLKPFHDYQWSVRTWNRSGGLSEWAAPQRFRTAALRDPWEARKGDDRITVTRYPIAQTEVAPVHWVEIGPGHYFADFGRDAFAGLKLVLAPSQAGQTLVVHLGEMLDSPSHLHRKPPGSLRYHRAEITLHAGSGSYLVPLGSKDDRLIPLAIGPVMPFRYVELENAPASLTSAAVRQQTAHYPFDETASAFSSSDPHLNAIWELCRYSIKATSCFGVYVDGDRERLPYEADAYINQLGHYSVDREFTLARYSLETLILHPTWPTEWSPHLVMMAWEDYLHTGDTDCISVFYEDLKAKTLLGLAREDGLVSTTTPPPSPELLASLHAETLHLRDIVDWPSGERDGYDFKSINTVVNAFHYRAMLTMAQIAEALNKRDDARSLRRQAEKVAQAFNATLFDARSGLYRDGEGSGHSSLHANMFALAFGLVPPERMAPVAAFVRTKGMACSVYGAQYLLEALYRSGQADHALNLMLAPGDRSWRHMAEEVGTTVTTEAWDRKYKPNQDWNHAWGAAPANILPRLLMGVEPTAAGYHRMRIRPQPAALTQAALDLPTLSGTVHVDFVSRSGQFTLNVDLPANTSAEILLPHAGRTDTRVCVDGMPRQGIREGDFLKIAPLGSGTHTLTLSTN